MRFWSRLGSFIRKLRRRGVLYATAGYAVGAWVVVQVAAATFPALPVPSWAHTLVVLLAILGLPVVVAVAWAYEITPEGIRRTAEEEKPPELLKARGTPWGALLLVVVVTAGSAGLGWAAWDLWVSPGQGTSAAAADAAGGGGSTDATLPRTRVAVLPFDGRSAADSAGTVADGLTLSLIKELDRVSALDVVSHHGVRPFRDADVPLDSVAGVLGAGSLVTGSVEGAGDSLAVTVQLVDGRTLSSDWTGTIRTHRDSLLELRDLLASEAVRGLRRALGEELQRESQAGADSDVAWELFHRAKRLEERGTELRLEGQREIAARLYRRADSLLAEAKERDTDWRQPALERGWLDLQRAQLPGRALTDLDAGPLRAGIEHAERVLDAEPGHPGALELRGALLNALGQLPDADSAPKLRARAIRDLERAVGQDPDRARAWAELSDLYRREGRFEDARNAAADARQADAFLINEAEYLQKAHSVARDIGSLERALELARRGRRLFPNSEYWDAARLLTLSAAGAPLVPPDSLWSILRSYERLYGRETPFARMQVAAALARQGMGDSARSVLRRAKAAVPKRGRTLAWYYEANVRLHLGQRERAAELLGKYLEAYPGQRQYVKRDVYWRSVRDDPAFRALMDGES